MKTNLGTKILILLVFSLLSGSAAVLFGQNVNMGQIRGTVSDASGAVIPEVSVVITNMLTGISTRVTTNAGGVYDAPTLLPGTYSIAFTKQGFNTFVRNGVVLHVEVIAIDAQLQVGSVTQRVTVTAAAPVVQSESSDTSTTLTSEAITMLPNGGMTWFNYESILPGVSPNTASYQGTNMCVNGSGPYASSWLVNGSTDQFVYSQNPDVVGDQPLESIAEIYAGTSNFSAEYGNGSSVFNVITKRGTNQWHGALFEYAQNTALNARNFFGTITSPWHWNQFGGNVGGPVKRDKAFFFFTYQDYRQITYSPTYNTVPTAQMLQGNLSGLGLPTIYDPASLKNGVRTALPNNVIPSAEIDPVGLKIAQSWPAPNYPGTYNNYYAYLRAPFDIAWYNGAFDYNISSSNRLAFSSSDVQEYHPSLSVLPHGGTSLAPREQQYNVSDSWSISPTVVNQFNLGMLRYYGKWAPFSIGQSLPQQLGLINPQGDVFPSVSVSGTVSMSYSPGTAQIMAEGTIVPSDILTIVRGKHIIKLGGEYDRNYVNFAASFTQAASLSFNGYFTRNPSDSTSTGLGFADLLLGLPSSWSVNVGTMTGARMWNTQLFGEDDYKITQKLMLNIGLRYSIAGGWGELHNRFAEFSPTLTNPATNTLGSLWFDGQMGRTALENTNANGFGPRIGFAWSPKSSWAVRGAYGIFDMPWEYGSFAVGTMGQGWSVTGSKSSTNSVTPIFTLGPTSAALAGAYPGLSQGPPLPVFPSTTPSATMLNGQSLTYLPYNAHIPYMQQGHLDIEHQLSHRIFLDAGYVWTRAIHIHEGRDINQVPAALLGPGNMQPNRPFPQYQGITALLDDGYSNYNSLQLTVKREFSQGAMFAANYTWAKNMDTGTPNAGGSGTASSMQNSYAPRANYGLADYNRTSVFNGYFAYELPFGRGKHFSSQSAILNQIIGGWRLSSIFQVDSGFPFTPAMGTANLSGSLAGTWHPNRIASGKLSNPSIHGWFDPAAFVQPAQYTFGNSGRGILIGPGYRNLDLSLAKAFSLHKLGEGGKLEFRMDALDALNHSNFGNPNASILGSGVGTILYSSTSRVVQINARLAF